MKRVGICVGVCVEEDEGVRYWECAARRQDKAKLGGERKEKGKAVVGDGARGGCQHVCI